jgi:hypothetical protein
MGEDIQKQEEQQEEQVSEKPLEEMTVKELREIAKTIEGLSGISGMRKEELLAAIRKDRGIAESPEKEEAKDQLEKPLDKMTATELREIAKEIPGVTGTHAMKKEELLAVIKKDRGIKEEKPAKKKKIKTEKPTLNVKELKARIIQLREEKDAARKGKDRKRVDILRRRINRLKKQTRKVAGA